MRIHPSNGPDERASQGADVQRSACTDVSRRAWGVVPRNLAPAAPLVLVIEDDDEIRDLLVDAGYRVSAAIHGAAALEQIQQEQPRLILLDMHMPVMDGRAFVSAYEQAPGPHAPIIVLAAFGAEEEAAQMGTAGYCSKPFDVDALLDIVQEHVDSQPPVQAREQESRSSVVNLIRSSPGGSLL